MAITRPRGEQLRFVSAETGEHVLDAYMEACEKGGRALYDLLEDVFDPDDGALRPDLLQLRQKPGDAGVLQARFGVDFVDPEAGWEDIFNMAGANVVAVSAPIVAGVGDGTIQGDVAATDFTGHPEADGTALYIQTNHYVRFFHNELVYEWAGERPALIGVGGTTAPVAADFAVATESVDGVEDAPSNDQTFGRRNAQWVDVNPDTGVVAGTYDRATITVDASGKVTEAANGAAYPTQDDIITYDLLTALVFFGVLPGWDSVVQDVGATPPADEEKPEQQVWSKDALRIRATYTYVTTGLADGSLQTAEFEYSTDSGSSYSPVDTANVLNIQYTTLGNYQSSFWSA
jgi:hypothetical protein